MTPHGSIWQTCLQSNGVHAKKISLALWLKPMGTHREENRITGWFGLDDFFYTKKNPNKQELRQLSESYCIITDTPLHGLKVLFPFWAFSNVFSTWRPSGAATTLSQGKNSSRSGAWVTVLYLTVSFHITKQQKCRQPQDVEKRQRSEIQPGGHSKAWEHTGGHQDSLWESRIAGYFY